MANLLFQSEKSQSTQHYKVTIFTPTFNRKSTIPRTYESLKQLKCNNSSNFEWIIVDDGSNDNTEKLGELWCKENIIPIRYFKQKNQGKHIAMNFAIQNARGEFWLTIDSDDTILPDALDLYINTWNAIKNKELYCGVSARCIDESGNLVGSKLPYEPMDTTFTDLRFKYNIKGDMLEFYKTNIIKQYTFPTYDTRMRFCPEAIVWHEIAKKYKLRVINKATLIYYHDAPTSIIKEKNIPRSISNYYLWLYYINNLSKYILSNPIEIIKAYVGISMDGLICKKSIKTILQDSNSSIKRLLVLLLLPLGKILSLK